MTKSVEYAIESRPGWFSESSEEVPSIDFFEEILQGEREKVQDTKVGIIKTIIIFNENEDFNYCNGWDLDVNNLSFTNKDEFGTELEEQIMNTAIDTLCNDAIVPCENGEPLGGWPTNGDIIEYTIGNYVLDRHGDIIKIALPVKYKLIPGIYHE